MISLTPKQQTLLFQMVRRQTAPQRLVSRAQIILTLAQASDNQHVAQQLLLNRNTVSKWRCRWLANASRLLAAEEAGEVDSVLTQMIELLLTDAPRQGAPATFTPEEMTQIMALACEDPQVSQRPISHWTPRELADEAVKRGMVSQISPRSVGRFLKGGCD